ncbi:dihydrofolate reductase family protein [Kitasatospora sp. DSM 101779]|uniref:dihydrofolate reductase family protein n=1 Tax=Kitasatospora sp. DSM 101779 TaxID=2853165 RepID=UPI0021DAA4D9|nr:dihydrofolate reductase family protein [Kitasatospora sp. DSM 101779]MCU7821386.1 dihydrofolate reductase family protein [Kitasatospora sp. DSM 101779]
MRKIVMVFSASLDGYIERPDRRIDWHLVDEELHQHMNDMLRPMGGFLSGRVTYDLMADYWPTADADPDAPGPIAEFAEIWRSMPKIVFSRTLTHADWNTEIRREVVPAEIEQLKAQPGGDLALGGADLAAAFLRHDLVDEYRIYVHPVLIGEGKPLFPPAEADRPLHLVETRTFGNGVVLLHYGRPAAS